MLKNGRPIKEFSFAVRIILFLISRTLYPTGMCVRFIDRKFENYTTQFGRVAHFILSGNAL